MTNKHEQKLLTLTEDGLNLLLNDFFNRFENVYDFNGNDGLKYIAEDVAAFLWVRTSGYFDKYRHYNSENVFITENLLAGRDIETITNTDLNIISESHEKNKEIILEAIKKDKLEHLITGESKYVN